MLHCLMNSCGFSLKCCGKAIGFVSGDVILHKNSNESYKLIWLAIIKREICHHKFHKLKQLQLSFPANCIIMLKTSDNQATM